MTGDAPSPGQSPSPADEPRQAAPAAPLALYRRYRPATFAEVKGQDHVTEPLRQALRSGRVNHAYLFSGPRGCGKTSSARILARSLNCEKGPTPDPCGVCASCVALAPAGPGSIDVIEIDAASHGGVDDARDLRERAFYAPVSGRYKVYIIDEAHMVTREGFNALLKLVEEPPPHLKFVFATTEPEKVIPTIRSRTHHYPFRLVPPAILRELLEEILSSEGIDYEPAVLPVVIRAGAGSVRDSLSVLDQLIAGSDESGLSYARAVALLGYTDERLLDEVAEAFASQDGGAVFRAIDRVVEAGHDPRRFAADLLDRLRDLIVLAAVPDAASTGLLDLPADRLEAMRAQADAFGQAELARAAEIISAGLVEMRGATSPRLLLELMSAHVLLPGAGERESDLRVRLDRLERRLESGGMPQAPAARPARPSVPAAPAAPAVEPAPAAPAAPPVLEPSQTPEPAQSPTPAPAAEAPASVPSGTADAEQLRERWPDVLEVVRQERKVAWILLTNATVESLTGDVLTVMFVREGDAKGFAVNGHDRLLSDVLSKMFGISPQVKATARPPGAGQGGPGPGGSGPGGSGGSGPGPRPGGTGAPGGQARGATAPGRDAGESARAAGTGPRAAAGPQASGQQSAPQQAASSAGPATAARQAATPAAARPRATAGAEEPPPPWDEPPEPWDDPRDDEGEYEPAGPPGPAAGKAAGPGLSAPARPGRTAGADAGLSAVDLIERELGGRVVEGVDPASFS